MTEEHVDGCCLKFLC